MTNHPSPIRVGMIGAGDICRTRHLPGLGKIEGVELVAVCNRTEASSRRVADAFGFKHIEKDWQSLVQRADIDAVFIGTWPNTHAQMSIAALEAGKHVFCQARMAATLDDARDMVRVAELYPNQISAICPPPHRMPFEPYIKKLLVDGALGELREVRVTCINNASAGPLHWRDRVECSGIQIMQVGIWAEVLNAWVGEYAELTAQAKTPIATKPDEASRDYPIRIPQYITITGTLKSGVPIREEHDGANPDKQINDLVIVGKDAALMLDVSGPQLLIRRGPVAFEPIDVPKDLQRYWCVERDFIDAVRTGHDSSNINPNFATGLQYMQKVAAIHQSAAADGSRVTVK